MREAREDLAISLLAIECRTAGIPSIRLYDTRAGIGRRREDGRQKATGFL